MKTPYPWFGGKVTVAAEIWQRFGDVGNFVDPFFGGGAVLLNRPAWHKASLETINDLDHYVVNFWRAVASDADAVARYVDWPVTECDLTARHLWLITDGRQRIANLETDPFAYDAQVAGWWVWGISCWIGDGWCSGDGPWTVADGALVQQTGSGGVSRRRPHLSGGRGVHRTGDDVVAYIRKLAARFRRVRSCCGDWQRVLTDGALAYGATVGVLLDPPYAHDTGRDTHLYNHEMEISAAVREWALAHGDNPRFRIALCGYHDEHDMPAVWDVFEWAAHGGYSNNNSAGNDNKRRERIWFSPHCLRQQQSGLFEEGQ